MGAQFNGDRQLVTAGFPPEAYPQLHRRIWMIGELLMPLEFDQLASDSEETGRLLPATLSHPAYNFDEGDPAKIGEKFTVGSLAIELQGLRFGINRAKKAVRLGCTALVSIVEEYKPYRRGPYGSDEWELWSSLGVVLEDGARKNGGRVSCWRESSVRSEDVKILVDDRSAQPRTRAGRTDAKHEAWLAYRDLGRQGSDDDYMWLLGRLDTMIADLQLQEHGE